MPPWDSLCDYQCPLKAPPPDIPSESPLTVSLKFPTWLFPLIFSSWHLLRMFPPASPDDVSFLMVSPPYYPLMESPDPVPLTVYPVVSLMASPHDVPFMAALMVCSHDIP